MARKKPGTCTCGVMNHKPNTAAARNCPDLRASTGRSNNRASRYALHTDEPAPGDDPTTLDPWGRAEELVNIYNRTHERQIGFAPRHEGIGEDKGILSDVISMRNPDGALIGTLEVCYLNEPVYQRMCPTPWHHAEAWNGKNLGLYEHSGDWRVPDVPLELTAERYEAIINKPHHRLNDRRVAEQAEQHILPQRLPYVGWSESASTQRREGIATDMYSLAVATYGGLAASGLQSDTAKGLWSKLRTRPDYQEWTDADGRERSGLISDWERFSGMHLSEKCPDPGAWYGCAPMKNRRRDGEAESVLSSS